MRFYYGDSWTGAGVHEGHTITAVEWWPGRVESHADGDYWTTGLVRCTCGAEWTTGAIWPPAAHGHFKIAHNTALCERAGESRPHEVWGQTLTEVRDAVTCPRCLDWLHA